MSPVSEPQIAVIFFYALFAVGLVYVAVPGAVVRFFKRIRWPDGYWSGGIFFTTERSTRLVGLVHVVIALFGLHGLL